MAQGYDSPKLKQHIGDGFAFMKENKSAFDVIITDSSDPVGELAQEWDMLSSDWFKLAQISPDWFRQVQTGSDWLWETIKRK